MSETAVIYDVSDGIATLTLNRPEVYHALNAQLHADLMVALQRAERDPAVRCVVIIGTGKAFSSGQDLREIPIEGADKLIGERLRASYNPLVSRLRSINRPVIAAVNGVAAGAGMSLALACDFRIASSDARFVAAFVNIGLIPDCGMTYFLPRLIGHSRALEMAMSGMPIDAATALQWGLVNAVASPEEFPAAVRQFAERLAAAPATVIGLIKRSFEMSQYSSLEAVLEYEAQAQIVASLHPDFAEGVTAFREKRPARWE